MIKVKELVWIKDVEHPSGWPSTWDYYRGNHGGRTMFSILITPTCATLSPGMTEHATLEEAKAAAQDHWERVVRAALVTPSRAD